MGPSHHQMCRGRSEQPAATADLPRIAVAVIAAQRPAYLKSMLQALGSQETNVPFDVHLFIDFCETDGHNSNAAVKRLAEEFQTARRGAATNTTSTFIHSDYVTNQGIARLTWAAMETAFANDSSEDSYDQLVLLEEDHVIAPNYIATLSQLLLISDSMDSIGVVAGTILNVTQLAKATNLLHIMPNTNTCRYQIAPLDGFTSLSSHNIWAWGMSRHKYSRIRDVYLDGLRRTGLLSKPYARRDTHLIARWMRSTCGSNYHHWQGQDWLRACALASAGMPFKLQTVDRTLQYIGEYGLHTNAKDFASKQYAVEAPVPTQRLERMQEDMCSEALCYSDVVTVG